MKYLLDTNFLLRLVELTHQQHKEAGEALKKLKIENAEFYILLQNISQFWNVCTRPKEKNGLGLSIAEIDLHLKRFERFFKFLPDTEEVCKNWRELESQTFRFRRSSPRRKNRRRLKTHNIENLLTFNARDFKRRRRHQSRRTERPLEFLAT